MSTTDLISSYFPKSYGEIALAFDEGTGRSLLPGFRTRHCGSLWREKINLDSAFSAFYNFKDFMILIRAIQVFILGSLFSLKKIIR